MRITTVSVLSAALGAAAGAAVTAAIASRCRCGASLTKPDHVQVSADPVAVKEEPAPVPKRHWVRVGTDASLGGGGKNRGSGIGFIAEDGRHGSQFVKQVRDTTSAELLAVITAVEKLHQDAKGRECNVHVLTDSRAVLAILNDPAKAPVKYQQQVKTLVQLRKRGELEVTWVKGHAGHPLNEGADRLARDVRRCKQQGIKGRAQVQANIVEETLTALKGLTSTLVQEGE